MNCLLFAPPLGLLLWKRFGFVLTLPKLAICAAVQIVLALPFLVSFPLEYFHGAFDFSRQFKYVWTVSRRTNIYQPTSSVHSWLHEVSYILASTRHTYTITTVRVTHAKYLNQQVNLKFLPEDVFLDKRVGLALLAAHVVVLLLFLNKM